MKRNQMMWSAVCTLTLAGALLTATAKAGTVAYWRFEQGPADTRIVHLSGANGVWSPDVADSSGNGNALSAWTGDSWGGEAYKTDVPFAVVPQTGEVNNFSIKNTGGFPGLWNESLNTWAPSQWTVEATFKPENGGYRTIVGRDSKGAGMAGVNPDLAAMYFQLVPGNAVAIKFEDVSGYWHEAISAPGVVTGFDYPTDPDGRLGHWYGMAGVSTGSNLSLYLKDITAGASYQLVAQVDLSASGSPNTALTPGMGSGGDWKAGNFSVMRGLYAGNHVDRGYGFIDEVRLSDIARQDFLGWDVPEPGTLSLVMLSGLPLLLRRRKATR